MILNTLFPVALRRGRVTITLSSFALLLAAGTPATSQSQLIGVPSYQDAVSGRWQKLTNEPTFQTDTALLLTDGTVMTHQYNSNNWWRLTPDINGSYLNGTWSQLASMTLSYAPLYFASATLPDGRVLV